MAKRTNKIKIMDGVAEGVKEIVTMGLASTIALNTFPFNTTANTEAAAAYCKTYDLSATEYQNVATSGTGAGYAANYQLWPGTEQIGDAVYFGASTPFGCIYTDVSTTGATYSNDAVTWEYWDGNAWVTLTIIWDMTDSTANDGKRPFIVDGYTLFSAPTNWALTTVDSQSAYWIRARLTAATVTQIPLLNSHEHYTVAATYGTQMPYAGTISRGRFLWMAAAGTTADTKLILVNFTSGACSAIKTHTKTLTEFVIADFALPVAIDDKIGFYCTQIDGSAENADGTCELTVTRTS